MMAGSQIRLATWDIGGIMSNVLHLQNILRKSDICVLLEHWLYPDSLTFLSSVNEEFVGWGRSSYDLNLDSLWRRGKGGVAFLWRKTVNAYVTRMENLGNDRILVIRVEAQNWNFYVVGVYLPSSNQPIEIYRRCLDVLEDSLNQLDDADSLFVLGDFNTHIGGYGGPRSFLNVNDRGRLLISFMERMNFNSVNSQLFCKGPVETFYAQEGRVATSVDHILATPDDMMSIIDCCVQEEQLGNLSYHLPVFCTLRNNFLNLIFQLNSNDVRREKLCWKQITNPRIRERYQEHVSKEISNHLTEVSFNDVQDMDDVIGELNNILEISANKTIPKRKFKACLNPYWNADFKQLHFILRACRRKWVGAGKPRSNDNEFFKRYKDAKREFRKQLRRKALDEEVKENSSLHRVFEMDRSEFHKRITKKRKRNAKNGNVLKIDGQLITETTDVLEVWKDHYKELYSPLKQNSFDEQFKEFVEKKIEEYSIKSLEVDVDPLQYPFAMGEVAEVCRNLPNGKASGLDGIQYEHFKYAGVDCWNLLTKILNFIRECEQLPESTTVGVILSLFKGKKKVN